MPCGSKIAVDIANQVAISEEEAADARKTMYYNMTNKEALPSKANHKLLARNTGKASVISVANLLQNVKDETRGHRNLPRASINPEK